MANRILRLYVSTENPTENLGIISQYILKVYAPVWFETKCMPFCTDGAKHFFSLVEKSRFLSQDLRAIVDPVLKRNAYFAHQENILISMICDPEDHIRTLGYRRIQSARANYETGSHVRTFKLPKINLSADTYHEMIDWTSESQRYSPPIVSMIPDETICELAKVNSQHDLLEYICNTLATRSQSNVASR